MLKGCLPIVLILSIIGRRVHGLHTLTTRRQPRNAVFTVACRYRYKKLPFTFFDTLRRTGFAGDVVVAVDPDLDSKSVEYLHKVGATLRTEACSDQQDAARKNSLLNGERGDTNITADEEATICDMDPKPDVQLLDRYPVIPHRYGGTICQTRYSHYRRWLDEGEYDAVWLLDVRDVFFQADPFSHLEPGVSLFVDWNKINGHMPDWEARQIASCMSAETQKKVHAANVPNLCGGTIAGTGEAMAKFLDAMEQLIHENRPRESCKVQDQHILIALAALRKEELHLRFYQHWSGPALNSATICKSMAEHMNDDGWLVNDKNEIISVIHKFDMCKVTQEIAKRAKLGSALKHPAPRRLGD